MAPTPLTRHPVPPDPATAALPAAITLQAAIMTITQHLTTAPVHPDPHPQLAAIRTLEPRHWRVLVGTFLYYSTDEIAQLLGVQPKTVSNYRGQICERVGCASIEQACRIVQAVMTAHPPPD